MTLANAGADPRASAILAALLASAGVAALLPERPRSRAQGRRKAQRHPRGLGGRAIGLLAGAGARIRPAALLPPEDLERRIAAAGLIEPGSIGKPQRFGTRELMAAKLAGACAGLVAGSLFGGAAPGRLAIVLALLGPVGGFLAPDLWLIRRARKRARDVRRELPALLDLLRVTVAGGLSLQAAIPLVGERHHGTLAREWRVVGHELRLGVPLVGALAAMRARLPLPEITALVGALERASRHGAPLGATLAAQARDARHARRRRIQEHAARAGPKIQLVVAVLLVPAVLLLVAAGLVAALLERGGGLAITGG